MKICKECGNSFNEYKTTDKYCSYACASKNAKPIQKQSDKLKESLKLYKRIRKKFLADNKDKSCPVAKLIFNQTLPVTEIHHKAGRIGSLLNNTDYFLAVSRKGHDWIDNNPYLARRYGFLIKSSTK